MKHVVSIEADMGVSLDVLQALKEEARQTPEMLDEKLPYSYSHIKSALSYLAEMNHVVRVVRGMYEITELGLIVLHHPLNVKEGEGQ